MRTPNAIKYNTFGNSSEEYYVLTTEPDNENLKDLYIFILIILLLVMITYIYHSCNDTTNVKKKKIKKRKFKKNLSTLSSGSTFEQSAFSNHLSVDSLLSKHATPKSKIKSRVRFKRKRKNPISMKSKEIVSELNSTVK